MFTQDLELKILLGDKCVYRIRHEINRYIGLIIIIIIISASLNFCIKLKVFSDLFCVVSNIQFIQPAYL